MAKRLFFLLLTSFSFLHAQQLRCFDQCSELKRFDIAKGDTVVVKCGKAVMMSEPVFELYNTAYKKYNSEKMKELVSAYENIIAGQNRRIEEQNRSYDSLRKEMRHFVDSSGKVISSAIANLETAGKKLDDASFRLSRSKDEIISAQKDLEKALKIGTAKKTLWGAGGFISGVLMTLMIGVVL